MSICKECAATADLNRALFESKGIEAVVTQHPKDCNCPCQHREVREWEDYFSNPRPNEKDE